MADNSVVITVDTSVFPSSGSKPFLNMPNAADLRSGVVCGNATALETVTGTLNIPAVTDVKAGVSYDGGTKTGSLQTGTGKPTQVGGAGRVY